MYSKGQSQLEVQGVQLDTFLKLGSLAFGVVQDEKVRELAGLIHNGAKRRGVFAPWPGPGQVSSGAGEGGSVANQNNSAKPSSSKNTPIPFAPVNSASAAKGGAPAKPATQNSQTSQNNLPIPGPLNKYLTANNAKKALNMAGEVMNLLVK